MANITRWDPFRDLADFRNTFDHRFVRGVNRPFRVLTWEPGEGPFPVDIYETDEDVVVKAALPGVKPEEVNVSITGSRLTIKGETKSEIEDEKPSYYRRERRSGTFQRTLNLPVRVDADAAEATFEDGVVNLRLPKAAEVRSKTIDVKAATAAKA